MSVKKFCEDLLSPDATYVWKGNRVQGQWLIGEKGDARSLFGIDPRSGAKLMTVEWLAEFNNAALAASGEFSEKFALQELDRAALIRPFYHAIFEFKSHFIRCLNIEGGRPWGQAEKEIDAALKYLSVVLEKGSTIESQLTAWKKASFANNLAFFPKGTAVGFLPFSTPLMAFCHYWVAAVYANTPLILMGSKHTYLLTTLLSYIEEATSLPKGMLSILFGDFKAFQKLCEDKLVSAVFYTGSKDHCLTLKKDLQRFGTKKLILKSGGKNSTLVHSSADVPQAVDAVINGAFSASGQLCSSTSRVFVYDSLLSEFKKQLTLAIENIKVKVSDEGDPKNAFYLGPLFSQRAVDLFLRVQTMARREEDENWSLGSVFNPNQKGYFVNPAVHFVEKYEYQRGYHQNVLFGPDLTIFPYDKLEDAISAINDTDAHMVTSFIGDEAILHDWRHLFLAPNLVLNAPTTDLEYDPPFVVRYDSSDYTYYGISLALKLTQPQVLKIPHLKRNQAVPA